MLTKYICPKFFFFFYGNPSSEHQVSFLFGASVTFLRHFLGFSTTGSVHTPSCCSLIGQYSCSHLQL